MTLLTDNEMLSILTNSLQASQKACETQLNLSKWEGKRVERKIDGDVVAKYNSVRGKTRTTKELVSKKSEPTYGAAMRASRAIYDFWVASTTEWIGRGRRALNGVKFLEVSTKVEELVGQLDSAVDALVAEWPAIVERQREELGALFDEAQYPTAEEIRGEFSATIKYMPIAPADAIALDLDEEAMAKFQASAEAHIREAIAISVGDVYKRLKEPLAKMVATLRDPSATFKDTLTANITDVCDAMPTLNMFGDARLDALATELRELCNFEQDDVRSPAWRSKVGGYTNHVRGEDAKVKRQAVADQGKAILDKIGSII
jgi:hypothetical protein|tara:strand:+ start:2395 stop:3345 length:951 start_codon:yes stop_codon:yes gene_type:complete